MKNLYFAILISSVLTIVAGAQVVTNISYTWNFDTATPLEPSSSSSSIGSVGTYVSSGPVITALGNSNLIVYSNSTSDYTNASGNNNLGTNVNGTNASSQGMAFSITLSNSNHTFQLTNFDLGSRSTTTGPTTIQLLASSSSNFTTPVTIFSATVSNNSNWSFLNPTLNAFSSSSNQVYFRLQGLNGNSSGPGNWRVDDITLAGSVIPEPTTYVLVAVALAGVVAFSRRKAKHKA